MKYKILSIIVIWFCFFSFSSVWAYQRQKKQEPQPKPSQTQPNNNQSSTTEAQEQKSLWVVRVASVERVKPGTENEPPVSPGETILKVGVGFQYTGPEGEISAPVLKIMEGTDKEHIMLGNLQAGSGFGCFEWLISASRVVLRQKPKTLASSTIAKCKDTIYYYYFSLPESPKQPLALVFADAKPLPLTVK